MSKIIIEKPGERIPGTPIYPVKPPRNGTPPPTGPRKMRIRRVGSDEAGLTLPYAPREVTKSNMADSYVEVSRAGLEPLVVREAEGVNRLGFTLFLGSTRPAQSVRGIIRRLEQYAQSDTPLRINYSSLEEGQWHITSMTVNVINRRPSDHEATQATVDIEFTRSTGSAEGLGPVTGGKGRDKPKNSDGRVVTYVVKKGDTLHKIANKFFKDTSRWKDIAKWNKIKNPRKLKVGRKLKIRLPKKKRKGR